MPEQLWCHVKDIYVLCCRKIYWSLHADQRGLACSVWSFIALLARRETRFFQTETKENKLHKFVILDCLFAVPTIINSVDVKIHPGSQSRHENCWWCPTILSLLSLVTALLSLLAVSSWSPEFWSEPVNHSGAIIRGINHKFVHYMILIVLTMIQIRRYNKVCHKTISSQFMDQYKDQYKTITFAHLKQSLYRP